MFGRLAKHRERSGILQGWLCLITCPRQWAELPLAPRQQPAREVATGQTAGGVNFTAASCSGARLILRRNGSQRGSL